MSGQPSIAEGYGGEEEAEIEGLNLNVPYSEGEATVLAGYEHWLDAKEVQR
jgi:hypothetical protein